MQLGFEHTYGGLPDAFFARLPPTTVREPRVVAFNRPLAAELRLDVAAVESQAALLFSGNELPSDASPLAMAYAGHQFGHFVPQLGDGRAILLGELRDAHGRLRDVQLKGSGLTPFSRSADGRAALGPMLREYLVSEAMHAFGIPTTRSLAVVATGERVRREESLPGAVLTRVAASHVRVGTFQYFAARGDLDSLSRLLDYVIDRHYPAARAAAVPALALLEAVVESQAWLIAQWLRVGFIHGVMNTDNMAISGETIDYGPCAFMDVYDPMTVFSSIDHRGRYAFGNQPAVAQWNLARFAETLVPLIASDTDEAVRLATAVVEPAMERCDHHYLEALRAKLGFADMRDGDLDLAREFLGVLRVARADYTLGFHHLIAAARSSDDEGPLRELLGASPRFEEWLALWRARLTGDARPLDERLVAMRAVSPAVIPRNHLVERALDAATLRDDLGPFHALLRALQQPQVEAPEFMQPPRESERVLQTFCGT